MEGMAAKIISNQLFYMALSFAGGMFPPGEIKCTLVLSIGRAVILLVEI